MIDIDFYNYVERDFGNGIKQYKIFNYGIAQNFSKPKVKNENITIKSKTIRDIISLHKHSVITSQLRAKKMVYDLARCNEWEYFITFTFNPDKINSFDYDETSKAMSKWIKNNKYRHAPDMRYVIVPELHKSGRYHFHGMFSNMGSIKFVDSGKKDKSDRVIFNVGNYKLGFTTATQISSSNATALYIGKYITKELSAEIKYKKRYWRSRNLNEPIVKKSVLDSTERMMELDLISKCSWKKEIVQHFGSFERHVTIYEIRE